MSSIIVFWVTILLATLPIIELRGAMPIGMSTALWGECALDTWSSAIASVIGGIVACFVVVLVFIPLKKILSKIKICHKFFDYFDNKANEQLERFTRKKEQKSSQNDKKRKKMHTTHSTMHDTMQNTMQNTMQDLTRAKIRFPSPRPRQRQKHDPEQNHTLHKCVFVFLFCATPLPFTGVWSAGALCSLFNLGFWASVLTLILANLFGSTIVILFCWAFQNYIDLVLTIMVIILVLVAIYYLAKLLASRFKSKDNSTFCD